MLGWYEDGQYIYIAREYYQQGNLRDFVLNTPVQSESWARGVVSLILGVLVELAASQLAHRNITPSFLLSNLDQKPPANTALERPDRAHASNSSAARRLPQRQWLSEGTGLPHIASEMSGHLDGEQKLSHSYDAKVDLWAVEIILYEMQPEVHPFRQPNPPRFLERQYQRFLRED